MWEYFPKRTDLSVYSQKYLDAIARRLNTRPRKTLGYRTPAEPQEPAQRSTVGAGGPPAGRAVL